MITDNCYLWLFTKIISKNFHYFLITDHKNQGLFSITPKTNRIYFLLFPLPSSLLPAPCSL
ncbi:MAG: hypothetical protein F6K55_16775 [Moorea sp. SIO4A3]|nr:hypothetical protein [Moorena sp. SIO4A3]